MSEIPFLIQLAAKNSTEGLLNYWHDLERFLDGWPGMLGGASEEERRTTWAIINAELARRIYTWRIVMCGTYGELPCLAPTFELAPEWGTELLMMRQWGEAQRAKQTQAPPPPTAA